MAKTEILRNAEEFIRKLFTENISAKMVYHNFAHTTNVVEKSRKIAKKSGLSDEDLEIVTLAAWFHDAGYTAVYEGHETKSIEIAEGFLKENGYPQEKLKRVAACINASRMPQNPQNLPEQVICDADLFHLGQEEFFEYSELLKCELQNLEIKSYTDSQWLKINIEFLSAHKYFTDYAREKYGPYQSINLIKAQKFYKKALAQVDDEAKRVTKLDFEKQKLEIEREKLELKKNDDSVEVEKEKIAMKKDSLKIAERGIETMFRNTIRTHVEFSSMADKKAQIMISINGVIVGFLVSSILVTNQHRFSESLPVTISAIFLIAVCLVCIVYAVLATRPKVTKGTSSKEDILNKTANLLFFGNFYNMSLPDFEWGMKEMMKDKDYLYINMINDLYSLGHVVGEKYKLLRTCYSIFMYGLIIGVIAIVLAFLLNPGTIRVGNL